MLLFLLTAVSCVPYKKLTYFNDINTLSPGINPWTQKTILPFDRLYIRVLSIDPQTSQIFNSGDEMRSGGYSTGGIVGYQVDEGGNIIFPFVGNVNVGTLTVSQAGTKIQKQLGEYFSNVTVTVKFIDNVVTVMGEVNNQGVFPFTRDKISIYEAIGLGGGLTRYGDRKNIILTRHVGDKIFKYRLNLSDSNIASKEYYYILPNDVIIVEPLKIISTSYTNITYTTILSSITTLIAVLLFTGVGF